MKILAIDPATLTGWAITVKHYGNISFKTVKGESVGVKWLRFEKWLNSMIKDNDIEFVAYERPGGRNTGAIIHHSKLNGVIEKVCESYNIQYKEYSSTAIKKFATQKGNSNKQLMVETAQLLYDYKGNDDNEADALHLLHMVKANLEV